MGEQRETRIKALVDRFRAAAGHPDVRQHAGFRFFPNNSCTWASYALGHLLAELEPDADWHIRNAESSRGGHDWLESGDLAVDATADQFSGYSPYVGRTPAPRPLSPAKEKRVELRSWDPAHQEALAAIRRVMESPTK